MWSFLFVNFFLWLLFSLLVFSQVSLFPRELSQVTCSRHPTVSLQIPQWATPVVSPPSVHTGNCYLTRMFSRLVKETLDLMTTLTKDTHPTQEGSAMLPSLTTTQEERQSVQDHVLSVLEKSWLWLAGVLDVVEGQLRMGKNFDTKVGLYLTTNNLTLHSLDHLYPNIDVHFLYTLLYSFPLVLTRRICLKIKAS